jgi:integrase
MITAHQLRGWAAKPPEKEQEVRGGNGFTVRVRPTGSIQFQFIYVRNGNRRKLNLGAWPDTSLAGARATHRRLFAELHLGRDPWEEAQAEKAAATAALRREREEQAARATEEKRRAALGTVDQLFDLYIRDLELDGKRTAAQYRRSYAADVKPAIGSHRANAVTTDDIADIVAAVAERGALTLANRVRGMIVSAFNFGMKVRQMPRWRRTAPEFGLIANPAQGVERALKRERRGQRYLRKDELRQFWEAIGMTHEVIGGHGARRTEELDIYTQIALKLLIATGQRVEEVLHSRWGEFELDVENGPQWVIPAERRKNAATNVSGEPHLVPLAEFHLRLLDELRPHATGTLLFPARKLGAGGEEQLRDHRNLSQAVTRLCARYGIEHFAPRDLRRTWKTLAGSIRINLETRNRIQGHAMDDIGSRHYDRYDYLDEKRQGMERWTSWLRGVLQAPSATAMPIAGRRAETPGMAETAR